MEASVKFEGESSGAAAVVITSEANGAESGGSGSVDQSSTVALELDAISAPSTAGVESKSSVDNLSDIQGAIANHRVDEDDDGDVVATGADLARFVLQNQSGHSTPQQQQIHDDDEKTNSTSTVSTLEASGIAGGLDDSGTFGGIEVGSPNQEDLASLHGDPRPNPEWLNNQMQVALNSGILPVTCKNLQGEMYLDKFGSGNRGKCIFGYNQWFTPTEFEAFAGRAQCKDWKRSIKFQDRSLLQLIEMDILKVHAVSCSCSACWNGESDGPIRLHDVKRKGTQSQSQQQQSYMYGGTLAQKRPYTHSRERHVDVHFGHNQTPVVKESKQLRLDVGNSQQSASALSGATLVQSPGGTLRLVQAASSPQSGQQQIKLNSQNGSQTVTLLIPQNALGAAQKQSGSKTPSSGASKNSQSSAAGIPLGLTYAPIQLMQSSKQEPDHWAKLEETVTALTQQVAGLRQSIRSCRQKSNAQIQDLKQQLEMEKEQVAWGRDTNRKLCANCNRPATVACARCERAYYCGEFCVRKDSALHRQNCMAQRATVEMVSIE